MSKKMDIYKFAKLAEVSTATISRAFTPNSKIGAKTKARILKLAGEINYAPNIHARSLNGTRNHVIGIIYLGKLSNLDYFYLELYRALFQAITAVNHGVLVELQKDDQDVSAERLLELLNSNAVDGLVLIGGSYLDFEEKVTRVISEFPAIAIGASTPLSDSKLNTVNFDLKRGIEQAVANFAGRSAPGFICHQGDNYKLELYRKALSAHGRNDDFPIVTCTGVSISESRDAARKLLTEGCDTLVCMCDHIAAGALQACQEQDLKVPKDIWVIGMDNLELGKMLSPPLSTVSIPLDEIAKKTIKLLFELIEHKTDYVNHSVSTHYCKRASTI